MPVISGMIAYRFVVLPGAMTIESAPFELPSFAVAPKLVKFINCTHRSDGFVTLAIVAFPVHA